MGKPRSQAVRDAARTGARLADALVRVAAEFARDQRLEDAAVVGAMISALGWVAARVARTNCLDKAKYERLITAHLAEVFQAEATRTARTVH